MAVAKSEYLGMANRGTLSPRLLSPGTHLVSHQFCHYHPIPFCVPLPNLSQALGHFLNQLYKEDKVDILIPISQKVKRLRDLLNAQNIS